MRKNKHPSSFRDPSGYIFVENGEIFRCINKSYFKVFAKFTEIGLYGELVEKGWLVSHEVINKENDYIIIKPEPIDFITYPYEWCFTQLKEAALLTLRIHQSALEYGMVLKDATAFNVQFHQGKPVFIDTLSFDKYNTGDPWGAYGQFCRHFLAPLLLMKHIVPDLNVLQASFIDGVPLEIVSKILPAKTHFSPFIKLNIHLHAKELNKYKNSFETNKRSEITLRTYQNIIQNMLNYISALSLNTETEWGDYYAIANYDKEGFEFKETTVKKWIVKYGLKKIWDMGGNNGHFSRLIQTKCDAIICSDIDPVAVDENYRLVQKNNDKKIIPLSIDYTNQSPGIGFANQERLPFQDRIQDYEVDCILALALIHHLSISANCTFEMLAESFRSTSRMLLIEFVHPEDSWAEQMLESKRKARTLFNYYNKQYFEAIFSEYFNILEILAVPNCQRTLYMMEKRQQ